MDNKKKNCSSYFNINVVWGRNWQRNGAFNRNSFYSRKSWYRTIDWKHTWMRWRITAWYNYFKDYG